MSSYAGLQKTRLYTYTIPIDDGAAPNPFRSMMSLAICKPGIRRTAREGDWVAGLGSKSAQSGDLSGHLVYAMRVEEILSLRGYDLNAPKRWPHRIPDIRSGDLSERLGDCIYDYSGGSIPVQRDGVHGPRNIHTDLSGQNVLISRDFYYFGNRAIPLPKHLHPIVHQTQGHKRDLNDPYVDSFTSWIRGLGLASGQMHGWPDYLIDWKAVAEGEGCAARGFDDVQHDPPC